MKFCEKFFSMLSWAVEKKDFEDFWPVGLESTGPRYWPQLAIDLERAIYSGKLNPPDFPTANVALAFCLIYGVRELNWPADRSSALFEAVFSMAQASKSGDLFNSDGSNLLWDTETLNNKIKEGVMIEDLGISVNDVYETSGQILALAESEYFMNHRIGTEKHGPYYSSDGDIYVVRSVKNLCPIELWPELSITELRNDEFHIIFKYHPYEVRFDVLSNLLTPLPEGGEVVSIQIADENNTLWDYSHFNKLSNSIRQGILIICKKLQTMTKQEKSERMTQILYYGCRNSLSSWRESAQRAIEIGRTKTILFPVPKTGDKRLQYYNLMEDSLMSRKNDPS